MLHGYFTYRFPRKTKILLLLQNFYLAIGIYLLFGLKDYRYYWYFY